MRGNPDRGHDFESQVFPECAALHKWLNAGNCYSSEKTGNGDHGMLESGVEEVPKDAVFVNPPLEAMACRTAVVSTRVGGVPDYGTHGESILLAEPKDLNEMTRHVSQLIEEQGLRETLSRNAEEASKEFTWDRSVETLEEILRSG